MEQHADLNLRGTEIVDADLREAWLRRPDLEKSHLRGADFTNAEIDGEIDGLVVNGVEVADLVEAELDRRHPERAVLRAQSAQEFRSGWAALETMWQRTIDRVETLPPGTVDLSVHGEWSFSQTLRHLVFATDVWLGDAILRREHPYHRLGQPFSGWRDRAPDAGIDLDVPVGFAEVLQVRAERVAQVRDYLDTATDADLDGTAGEPFFTANSFPVRQCVWIIANEEWHHHRYAVRDLDALADGVTGTPI
ncbi:DinB family protein [Flexivirga sp. B27]